MPHLRGGSWHLSRQRRGRNSWVGWSPWRRLTWFRLGRQRAHSLSPSAPAPTKHLSGGGPSPARRPERPPAPSSSKEERPPLFQALLTYKRTYHIIHPFRASIQRLFVYSQGCATVSTLKHLCHLRKQPCNFSCHLPAHPSPSPQHPLIHFPTPWGSRYLHGMASPAPFGVSLLGASPSCPSQDGPPPWGQCSHHPHFTDGAQGAS